MQYHILAGCGNFMGSLAVLMREQGHDVVSYDDLFQPPMSYQLQAADVKMVDGYDESLRIPDADGVVVGNAIKRGNPLLEKLMLQKRTLLSGPEYLRDDILRHRRTIAIAGTHGKTTTTAMMTWVLECLSEQPGFLIGGIPMNFDASARLGKGDWFCVEADEYDTVLWDKRPKFFYYPAEVLVINNLEFDHADIYRDLEDILRQFRYYLKTLRPGTKIVYPDASDEITALVKEATWCEACPTFAKQPAQPFHMRTLVDDWSSFILYDQNNQEHRVSWSLFGEHNAGNALMVFRALVAVGFDPEAVALALNRFQGVRRRMQKIGVSDSQQTVWDDYAHHPTALAKIIEAARLRFDQGRLIICLKLNNYTQREGVMWQQLQEATAGADMVWIVQTSDAFPYQLFKSSHTRPVMILDEKAFDAALLRSHLAPGDHVITCSSRDCSPIHQAVLAVD